MQEWQSLFLRLRLQSGLNAGLWRRENEKIQAFAASFFFRIPVFALLALSALSAMLLGYAFCGGAEETAAAYFSYALSAYTLAALCVRIPALWRAGRAAVEGNFYGRRYLNDKAWRARLSLYMFFFIHALYAVFKMVSGVFYRSVLFGAEAVYYLVLSLIRFVLMWGERKNDSAAEWKSFRLCGYLLLLLNAAMTGIAALVIRRNQSFEYAGAVIYATAAYTFFRLTLAAVQTVRFRKNSRPVLTASKVLNLSASLLSLFALQTALIARFGEDGRFAVLFNTLTGGAVCLAVVCLAVWMIARSYRSLPQRSEG